MMHDREISRIVTTKPIGFMPQRRHRQRVTEASRWRTMIAREEARHEMLPQGERYHKELRLLIEWLCIVILSFLALALAFFYSKLFLS